MEDLLRQGAEWLEEMRIKHLARPIIYVRGSQTIEVPATIGKTVFRFDKEYGLQERFETRDFLMLASDLILEGSPVLPKPGDCVRETDGNRVFSYEVMAPNNEPCWRYSDPYRKTLRVHTKLVATEIAP